MKCGFVDVDEMIYGLFTNITQQLLGLDASKRLSRSPAEDIRHARVWASLASFFRSLSLSSPPLSSALSADLSDDSLSLKLASLCKLRYSQILRSAILRYSEERLFLSVEFDPFSRPFCDADDPSSFYFDFRSISSDVPIDDPLIFEETMPLRLIFGGGWTDTPPYTLEVEYSVPLVFSSHYLCFVSQCREVGKLLICPFHMKGPPFYPIQVVLLILYF